MATFAIAIVLVAVQAIGVFPLLCPRLSGQPSWRRPTSVEAAGLKVANQWSLAGRAGIVREFAGGLGLGLGLFSVLMVPLWPVGVYHPARYSSVREADEFVEKPNAYHPERSEDLLFA